MFSDSIDGFSLGGGALGNHRGPWFVCCTFVHVVFTPFASGGCLSPFRFIEWGSLFTVGGLSV